MVYDGAASEYHTVRDRKGMGRRGSTGNNLIKHATNIDMNYFALFYDVVDDFASRRSPYREEHLRLAREAHRRGELLLAGAMADPADRALLVFRAPERSVV